MGDRANVVIPQEGHDGLNVYLYTHWGGSELPAAVQKALARRVRWDDQQYLARIIFDAMTEGLVGAETGHGITACPWDGQGKLVVVDTAKQEVRLQLGDFKGLPRGEPQAYSFEAYVALPPDEVGWPEEAD